jgi:hypothetical protein
MTLIKLKYWFLLLTIGFFNGCTAQNTGANQVLVFKVEHTNSKYVGYSSTGYSLLELGEINNFVIIENDSVDSPNITYNITFNGGYVISDAFVDFETLGCCEYGNIKKSVNEYLRDSLSIESLKKYSGVNDLSLKYFETNKGFDFSVKNGTSNYNVTVWIADLEYCVCDFYMASHQQGIYGNQGARLKLINSISEPNKETKKKINKLLKKLVEIDTKYQQ